MKIFEVGANQDIQPSSEKAMVTMALGAGYLERWNRAVRRDAIRYAERHGYDLIVVTSPLDHSERAQRRSPAWQKCLILDQPWSVKYDRIVWFDADIIINANAPDILEEVPPGKVGATISFDQYSMAQKHVFLELEYGRRIPFSGFETVWRQHEDQVYRNEGIRPCSRGVVQTGVLVVNTRDHQRIFRQAYGHESGLRCYEQTILSSLILENGLFHEVCPRFNWLVKHIVDWHFRGAAPKDILARREDLVLLLRAELDRVYFLHVGELFNLM